MRIVESLPGADERVVVISSRDDPSQERNPAEVSARLLDLSSWGSAHGNAGHRSCTAQSRGSTTQRVYKAS